MPLAGERWKSKQTRLGVHQIDMAEPANEASEEARKIDDGRLEKRSTLLTSTGMYM